MPKEKVTLTLDAARLSELRELVGARSLSAAIDDALAGYLREQRHFAAVDEWLADMERDDGPVPAETREWAAGVFDAWRASGDADRRAG